MRFYISHICNIDSGKAMIMLLFIFCFFYQKTKIKVVEIGKYLYFLRYSWSLSCLLSCFLYAWICILMRCEGKQVSLRRYKHISPFNMIHIHGNARWNYKVLPWRQIHVRLHRVVKCTYMFYIYEVHPRKAFIILADIFTARFNHDFERGGWMVAKKRGLIPSIHKSQNGLHLMTG